MAGSRALELAKRSGSLKLRLLTTSYLAQGHFQRGDYERTIALALDNLAALPADWSYETLGNTAPISIYERIWVVDGLGELGRFDEAVPHETEALRIAEVVH